jgi:hypothetical protein
MFRILNSDPEPLEIYIDDETVLVPPDVSLAAAMLLLGYTRFRHSAISASARAPYCMMGVCFECLVEVDALPNQRACQVTVKPGMRVRSPCGAEGKR